MYLHSTHVLFIFDQHLSSSSPEMAFGEEEVSPSSYAIPSSVWQSRRRRKISLPSPPSYFYLLRSRMIYLCLLSSSSSSSVKVTEERETAFKEVISSSSLVMILPKRKRRISLLFLLSLLCANQGKLARVLSMNPSCTVSFSSSSSFKEKEIFFTSPSLLLHLTSSFEEESHLSASPQFATAPTLCVPTPTAPCLFASVSAVPNTFRAVANSGDQ